LTHVPIFWGAFFSQATLSLTLSLRDDRVLQKRGDLRTMLICFRLKLFRRTMNKYSGVGLLLLSPSTSIFRACYFLLCNMFEQIAIGMAAFRPSKQTCTAYSSRLFSLFTNGFSSTSESLIIDTLFLVT